MYVTSSTTWPNHAVALRLARDHGVPKLLTVRHRFVLVPAVYYPEPFRALPVQRDFELPLGIVAIHHAVHVPEVHCRGIVAKRQTSLRSGDSAVCLSSTKTCSRLLLPELFAPKNPVIGRNVMSPVSTQDLKFRSRIRVSIRCSIQRERDRRSASSIPRARYMSTRHRRAALLASWVCLAGRTCSIVPGSIRGSHSLLEASLSSRPRTYRTSFLWLPVRAKSAKL